MKRHSWAKIEEHEYLCRDCALRKSNVEDERGGFNVRWTFPGGGQSNVPKTPECVVVPQSEAVLAEHWAALCTKV
jgi:hypothetical protein